MRTYPSVCLRCRATAPKKGCAHCPTCIPLAGYARYGNHGPNADNNQPSRPASCPTAHRPGSEGRIAALAARIERGEQLYHPDDAKLDLD